MFVNGVLGSARKCFAAAQRIERSSQRTLENIVPISLLAGSFGGSLGSLCGLGGGIVMIPALRQFTKLTTHEITATSLFAISLSSVFGAAGYVANDTADVAASAAIAAVATVTGALGAKSAQFISGKKLSQILAIVMLMSIPVIIRSGKGKEDHEVNTKPRRDGFAVLKSNLQELSLNERGDIARKVVDYLYKNTYLLVTGAITGFASGALGIGGGIVMTTCLASRPEKRMDQHGAVATSLVAMVPTGISATLMNMRSNNVHFKAGIALAVSSSLTMYYTARYIAPTIDEMKMRYLFAVVLGMSAVRMLL